MAKESDWMDMLEHMQEIRLFASLHIKRKKGGITSTQELDILSRIVMSKTPLTPLELSTLTGLSKPAVSRLIEHLEREGFLSREYSAKDKRSYTLLVTEKGNQEIKETYQHYLEPIYKLRRALGEDRFESLLSQIREANHILQNKNFNS